MDTIQELKDSKPEKWTRFLDQLDLAFGSGTLVKVVEDSERPAVLKALVVRALTTKDFNEGPRQLFELVADKVFPWLEEACSGKGFSIKGSIDKGSELLGQDLREKTLIDGISSNEAIRLVEYMKYFTDPALM